MTARETPPPASRAKPKKRTKAAFLGIARTIPFHDDLRAAFDAGSLFSATPFDGPRTPKRPLPVFSTAAQTIIAPCEKSSWEIEEKDNDEEDLRDALDFGWADPDSVIDAGGDSKPISAFQSRPQSKKYYELESESSSEEESDEDLFPPSPKPQERPAKSPWKSPSLIPATPLEIPDPTPAVVPDVPLFKGFGESVRLEWTSDDDLHVPELAPKRRKRTLLGTSSKVASMKRKIQAKTPAKTYANRGNLQPDVDREKVERSKEKVVKWLYSLQVRDDDEDSEEEEEEKEECY